MAIISKENILKVLTAFNPWWKTEAVNPRMSKTYKRFAFHEAMKRLDQIDIRRTVVLTGIRRVGKTTIQYQLIETLLERGIAPQKIVFISMDHPMLKLSGVNDVLECYHENIYAEQDVYYFFDEIQYAQDWDKWLKTIYDMQPETQVVATGSASPALIKGNQESGAGRWTVIQVPTMSFYEYCEILNLDRPELPKNLKATQMFHMTQQDRTRIMMQLSKVQNHFNRYLQVGGFPELALADNDLMAQQVMHEDVVDKVLKRDLPSLYNIRNAVLMDDSLLTDPVEMGKIVETAVYKYVAASYYQKATSVGYFRGGKKNKEIDIVVDYHNAGNILIEVKYREGAPIPDDDAIAELCAEASAAIVVTKSASDFGVHNTKSGKDMLRIPAFAFLYLLGHAEKNGYKGIG